MPAIIKPPGADIVSEDELAAAIADREPSGAYRPGGTDVAVADGGTGASSAADARTNLGVPAVADLTAEASTRASADTALDGRVDILEADLGGPRPPNGGAGGVLSGTYPNPGFAVDMAEQAELQAESTARAAADTALQTNIDAKQSLAEKGAADGYASLESHGVVPQAQLAGAMFNVLEYGAVADSANHPLSEFYGSLGAAQAIYSFVTDLTQHINYAATVAAINAATAAGGGYVYFPGGTYAWKGRIVFPNKVRPLGDGNLTTHLVALDADAQISIGEFNGSLPNSGPPCGNLLINGNLIANNPFVVGLSSNCLFENIQVQGGVVDNARLESAQNHVFINFTSYDSGRHSLVFDKGSWNNDFYGTSLRKAGGSYVASLNTTPVWALGQTRGNRFHGGIWEEPKNPAAPAPAVLLEATEGFVANDIMISTQGATVGAPIIHVNKLVSTTINDMIFFNNCMFQGPGGGIVDSTFLQAECVAGGDICRIYIMGGRITGLQRVYYADPRVRIVNTARILGPSIEFVGIGGATRALVLNGPTFQTGVRLPNNSPIEWADTLSGTFDTNLYRAGAGILKTDHKIQQIGTPSASTDLIRKQELDAETTARGTAIETHRTGAVHTQPQPPIIGSGATQAVAGNDSRLTDQRVPTDGSVTDAKVNAAAGIAQSKISGLVSDLAAKQPLDDDLTAIAALSTSAYGRSLLTLASQAALQAEAGGGGGGGTSGVRGFCLNTAGVAAGVIPSTVLEGIGTAVTFRRTVVDLTTGATEWRSVEQVQNASSHASTKAAIQYSLDNGGSWFWLDGTAGGSAAPAGTYISLAVAAGSVQKSSWVTIPVAAKAEVLVRPVCFDGNGSATAGLATIFLQVR